MVKMQNCGITIEVPDADVTFYKRAGYSVVDETAKAGKAATVKKDK